MLCDGKSRISSEIGSDITDLYARNTRKTSEPLGTYPRMRMARVDMEEWPDNCNKTSFHWTDQNE